jgi:hypothetical protein
MPGEFRAHEKSSTSLRLERNLTAMVADGLLLPDLKAAHNEVVDRFLTPRGYRDQNEWFFWNPARRVQLGIFLSGRDWRNMDRRDDIVSRFGSEVLWPRVTGLW